MNIIPITPETLDMIEVLNDGVRPALESKMTFFVFRGKDNVNDILTRDRLAEQFGYRWMSKIRITFYRSN